MDLTASTARLTPPPVVRRADAASGAGADLKRQGGDSMRLWVVRRTEGKETTQAEDITPPEGIKGRQHFVDAFERFMRHQEVEEVKEHKSKETNKGKEEGEKQVKAVVIVLKT